MNYSAFVTYIVASFEEMCINICFSLAIFNWNLDSLNFQAKSKIKEKLDFEDCRNENFFFVVVLSFVLFPKWRRKIVKFDNFFRAYMLVVIKMMKKIYVICFCVILGVTKKREILLYFCLFLQIKNKVCFRMTKSIK